MRTPWRAVRPEWSRREVLAAQRARFVRRWHSNRALGRLLSVNAVVRVAGAASGQLIAFLLADHHGRQVGEGSIIVGMLGTAFFMTELVAGPMAGRLVDRYGPTRILRLGPLLGMVSAAFAAATALLGDAATGALVLLLAARLAEGSSAACVVPPTLVVVARATPGDPVRRTRAMAVFEIGSLVGIITGYALAGLAWDAFGTPAFLLLCAVYGVGWLIAPPIHDVWEKRERSESVLHVVKRLFRRKGALPFAVAWLAVNAIVGLWIQYVPYLLRLSVQHAPPQQRLVGGFSGSSIGIVFGLWGLAFLVGLGLWSWLGGAMPRRRALAIALVGIMGVTACLAGANHGAGRIAIVIAVLFVLVQSGFTPSAFAHLADITEGVDSSRGAALGLYSLFLGLGQLIGGVLGAPMASRWQMDGVLVLTVALTLVALAGVLHMPRIERRVSTGD